jgi:hypothetical protein
MWRMRSSMADNIGSYLRLRILKNILEFPKIKGL